MELVFTRPEIGTYILLSGDSDFASLVTKLKEYGKYVIGVGIRESSSDLLVMNCDEYYSYNALAGLVKAGDEEVVKYDPWELVSEAIKRMSQNGDVMRSDRLKQVMQEIDNSFDEKNLGISKFSRFCLEAAQRGLISVNKLENGQLEVGVAARDHAADSGAEAALHAARCRRTATAQASHGRENAPRAKDARGARGAWSPRTSWTRSWPRSRGSWTARRRRTRGCGERPRRRGRAKTTTGTPPHGDKLVHPPAVAGAPADS